MFEKIIIFLLIFSLFIALFAFFSLQSNRRIVGNEISTLEDLYRKAEKEVEFISERVPPYIFTGYSTGFVVKFSNNVSVYFGGDITLNSNLKAISSYFKPDILFLPIGNIYTLGGKEAAFATSLINPKYVIPTSYSSSPELSNSPEKFLQSLKNYNVSCQALVFQPGEQKKILGINILWLGGENWLLEGPEGTRILINPGIRYNPQFPKEYQELIQLKKVDLVLITSGKFDKFTLSDARKWGQLFNPVFIAPYELGVWLKSQLPSYKIMALGGGAQVGVREMRKLGIPEKNLERIKIKSVSTVPANGTSSLTPEGSAL